LKTLVERLDIALYFFSSSIQHVRLANEIALAKCGS